MGTEICSLNSARTESRWLRRCSRCLIDLLLLLPRNPQSKAKNGYDMDTVARLVRICSVKMEGKQNLVGGKLALALACVSFRGTRAKRRRTVWLGNLLSDSGPENGLGRGKRPIGFTSFFHVRPGSRQRPGRRIRRRWPHHPIYCPRLPRRCTRAACSRPPLPSSPAPTSMCRATRRSSGSGRTSTCSLPVAGSAEEAELG